MVGRRLFPFGFRPILRCELLVFRGVSHSWYIMVDDFHSPMQAEDIPDVPDPESRRHRAAKTSKAWFLMDTPFTSRRFKKNRTANDPNAIIEMYLRFVFCKTNMKEKQQLLVDSYFGICVPLKFCFVNTEENWPSESASTSTSASPGAQNIEGR